MRHPEVDLNACIAGDGEAWSQFVDSYSAVIHAAVHRTMRGGRSGGDRSAIEDPVQDVFLRLVRDDFRLLRTYDPARAALSTWLTLIARSVAIDHLRKRRITARPLDAVEPTDGVVPAASDASAPEPPLHLLSERQGLVLRMLFDEDRSVTEVANRLGVDEQTVRSTKHKALTRLREHMTPPNPAGAGDAATRDPVQTSEGKDHGTPG